MVRERVDALVGAIEAGGTKFVCAVGKGPESILSRKSFPTGRDPVPLLLEVTHWLQEQQNIHGRLQAIGIASFGPVDLNDSSPTYGHITSTPKPGWNNTDIVGGIRTQFTDIPFAFDTDVNGAALGEYYWGNARGLADFVYITLGTGVGAGGMAGGQPLHGLLHPEMGHMLLPRIPGDDFPGICPYHRACWEGLCSGPALKERCGKQAEDLSADDRAWEFESQYIGYAIANIVCVLSPQRIIIGGSIRKAGKLGEKKFFQLVRKKVQGALEKYVVSPALDEDIGNYIVPPLLGDDAGICGAIALGQTVI